MVKVLSSFVRGPLEPHVTGFAEELLRLGYSRSSAGQHVCFIAHLDRWMQAEGLALDGLSGSAIERYLAQRDGRHLARTVPARHRPGRGDEEPQPGGTAAGAQDDGQALVHGVRRSTGAAHHRPRRRRGTGNVRRHRKRRVHGMPHQPDVTPCPGYRLRSAPIPADGSNEIEACGS